MAIDRGCTVTAVARDRPAGGRHVRPSVPGRGGGRGRRQRPIPRAVEPAWGRFVAGVVRALAERGRDDRAALELAIGSTVPVGSGLSSSSALVGRARRSPSPTAPASTLDRRRRRAAGVDAETAATGVPAGSWTSCASLFGRAGHALLIDCRSTRSTPVPIPPGVAVVVVHCGVPRTLVGREYASRRAECEAIAAAARASPRSATRRSSRCATGHARVTSSARTRACLATADALPRGDLSVLGPLLLASHASLRDDYEVSTPELDVLVELLVECGAAGARLTGAGFGGCVVALAQRNHADDVARQDDAALPRRHRHRADGLRGAGRRRRATGCAD